MPQARHQLEQLIHSSVITILGSSFKTNKRLATIELNIPSPTEIWWSSMTSFFKRSLNKRTYASLIIAERLAEMPQGATPLYQPWSSRFHSFLRGQNILPQPEIDIINALGQPNSKKLLLANIDSQTSSRCYDFNKNMTLVRPSDPSRRSDSGHQYFNKTILSHSYIYEAMKEYPSLSNGIRTLIRIRIGDFWHTTRLAETGIIPDKYLEQCPFCFERQTSDNTIHFISSCSGWALERFWCFGTPSISPLSLTWRNIQIILGLNIFQFNIALQPYNVGNHLPELIPPITHSPTTRLMAALHEKYGAPTNYKELIPALAAFFQLTAFSRRLELRRLSDPAFSP